jgi:hypothetical protein
MKVSRRSVLKGAAGIAAAGVGSSILGPNIARCPEHPEIRSRCRHLRLPARRASPPQFALESWASRSSSSRRNRASGDVASSTQATFHRGRVPCPVGEQHRGYAGHPL